MTDYSKILAQADLEQKLYLANQLIPPDVGMIFVFGSNEAGRHGAGAARYAYENKGAIMGVSFGPQGRSFAIPTKDAQIRHTLPLNEIRQYVNVFLKYAQEHNTLLFQVTQIGCGLAGLKAHDMAGMFIRAPFNCIFDTAWHDWLPKARFWGTFS